MQESKVYAGDRTPVKPGGIATGTTGGQRMECRIHTRHGESLAGSTLLLAGTLAEVLGWMQTRCPGGKIAELAEVRA